MAFFRRRYQVLALAGVALAVVVWALPGAPEEAGAYGDVVRNDSLGYELEGIFEQVEETTLAIEAALGERNLEALEAHLEEDVEADVPAPPPPGSGGDLYEQSSLGPKTAPRARGNKAVREAFGRYLDSFEVVADARFKLKAFEGDESRERLVAGHFRLELRGVLQGGPTIQDEVSFEGTMAREADRWRIRRLEVEGRTVTMGRHRLFTQVTRAGGFEIHVHEEYNIPGPFVDRQIDASNLTNLDYGGIACADADGDGRLDLYVTTAQGFNYLLMNIGGGRFRDRAEEAGVRSYGGSRTAVFGDVDNDGDQDLFVAKATFHHRKADPASNQLFLNDGSGNFEDTTARSGLGLKGESFSATFLDYDLDGDLDLYLCCYGHMGRQPFENYFRALNGQPNRLYRNRGDGTFEDVTAEAGVGSTGWSYAVAACDYDNDTWPDIYVANDYGPNVLYKNRGDGTFEETQEAAGVTDEGNGMGAAWVDLNEDGRFDLYTANMSSTTGRRILTAAPIQQAEERARLLKFTAGNSFFMSREDGGFDSVAGSLGIAHCGWSWHADFLDVDRDGREDLFAVNGYVTGVTSKDL